MSSDPSAAAAMERPGVHYKGVRMRKWGKWVAEVRLPHSRDRIWLGSYATADEAARAYDAAVFCLRGANATFNFPSSPPDIPSAGSLTAEQIREVAARHAREWSMRRDEQVDAGQAAAATPSESGEKGYSSRHEDTLELLRRLPLDLQYPAWEGRPGLAVEVEDDEGDCAGGDDKLWSYAMDEGPHVTHAISSARGR